MNRGVIAVAAVGALGILVMSKLTNSMGEIATYAKNAGFSGPDLLIAVAIAYAESSGNPNAKGDLDLGVSIGLWQINLRAHPEYTEQELYDPQTNADAAFAIYSAAGNSFRPWSTFKNGAYSAYLDDAKGEVNA
jgi:hypothetical protein